jgi:hypothetical protein
MYLIVTKTVNDWQCKSSCLEMTLTAAPKGSS